MADLTEHLEDQQKFTATVDAAAVVGAVKHRGIALRSKDASLVSASDPSKLKRVPKGFLKKKLALTDADLDAAIGSVMTAMKGDCTKGRVTVYYLLAEQCGKLERFQ